jgi:hypothetical protein
MDKNLLHSDNNSLCGDLNCPRPDAVILDPDSYDLWLDPGMQNVVAISELLKPDASQMRCYPVSTRINRVSNGDEECSKPVGFGEVQNHLFPSR